MYLVINGNKRSDINCDKYCANINSCKIYIREVLKFKKLLVAL